MNLFTSASATLKFTGTQYITLGGGNSAGLFNVASLKQIATSDSISAIKKAGYEGVMFDVEEVDGPASATVPAFAAAFAACKQGTQYLFLDRPLFTQRTQQPTLFCTAAPPDPLLHRGSQGCSNHIAQRAISDGHVRPPLSLSLSCSPLLSLLPPPLHLSVTIQSCGRYRAR